MYLNSKTRLPHLAGALAVLAAAAACSPAAQDAGSGQDAGEGPAAATPPTEASSGSMPTIYVSSRVENLRDGENPWRANYAVMLETCLEAGNPTAELSPEDVERIGVTRVERWFGPDTLAIRVETWGYGSPGEARDQICQFQMGRRGYHTYFDRSRTISVDLETGERREGPADLGLFDRPALDAYEGRQREQVDAARASMGGAQQRSVAGQACEQWRVQNADICTWSAGREWGFHALMPAPLQTDHTTSLNSRIILEQSSDVPGFQHVTTEAFILGAPLDQGAMMPRP